MKANQPTTRRKAPAGARRRGRQFGLALLYAADVGQKSLSEVLAQADAILETMMECWQMSSQEMAKLSAEIEAFGCLLAQQYLEHGHNIDKTITEQAEGWSIERMPLVDRNILRLALGEIWYLPDVPIGATIDEAVELAKKYATPESAKFINGILGAVVRQQVLQNSE